LHAVLPLEARKEGRHARVAVDRDQLALAAKTSGEQRGVASGAERAVDDGLPRPWVEGGDHLLCENRYVVDLSWQDARQHLPPSLDPRVAAPATSFDARSRGGRRRRAPSPRARSPRPREARRASRSVPACRARGGPRPRRSGAAFGGPPPTTGRPTGCARPSPPT